MLIYKDLKETYFGKGYIKRENGEICLRLNQNHSSEVLLVAEYMQIS